MKESMFNEIIKNVDKMQLIKGPSIDKDKKKIFTPEKKYFENFSL